MRSKGNKALGMVGKSLLRVAIVARDFPPTRGGLSTYAFGLLRQLRAQGVDVEVLVGGSDFRTLTIPLSRNLSEFDVVHVMSPPYAAFVGHPHLAVTVAEPAATEWPYYKFSVKLRAGPAYMLERRVFGRCKCFVALSEAAREKILSRFAVDPKFIRVIPGGVDLAEFSPGQKVMSPPRILLVSRLDRRKNIPEAFRALAGLKESFECVMVGRGPERTALERLASSLGIKVRFAGSVTDEQLRECYATSPVFLTSSHSEGFGLSLLQAMSAGCAVVASDIGAHRELVRDSENGLIYSSVDDLTGKLATLLQDAALIQKLGTAGRKSAEAYSWANIAAEMRKLYEELSRS
ncbi:MAG: glycosyltransferase family 4 protein [Nitrososphaerales archaeon]|nr:glycosyltransferase family 4 protein [Nitrososphaerales archaeon]